MVKMKVLLAFACLPAALLYAGLASAVPLGEYARAANDPARQMTIFRADFAATVANTPAALRGTHFKDGKEKSPQRIQSDQDRAERIERIAPHLTSNQAKALISMINEYAAAQPNTDLQDVIASFLLNEARSPLEMDVQQYEKSRDSYEATYRVFMQNMESWRRATDEAQAKLDREQADIDRRRRELDQQSVR